MKYTRTLLIGLFLLALGVAFSAQSHHILGTPHYAYDEEYPQTPTLTYSAELGAYKVDMTCFPGKPKPGENTSLHFYIKHRERGMAFDEKVTLTVFRDQVFGEGTILYGPVEAELEEAMFKFFPRFEDEGHYTVRIEYYADGAPWILDLPMVCGEPGSPWAILGMVVAVFSVFFVVIRAIRIKRKRLQGKETRSADQDEA